jgi:hypothetical protein
VLGDGVITPMPVKLALRAFLFHVRDFPARRELAIAADHASTRESSESQESYQAHCRVLYAILKASCVPKPQSSKNRSLSNGSTKTSRDPNSGAS